MIMALPVGDKSENTNVNMVSCAGIPETSLIVNIC